MNHRVQDYLIRAHNKVIAHPTKFSKRVLSRNPSASAFNEDWPTSKQTLRISWQTARQAQCNSLKPMNQPFERDRLGSCLRSEFAA